MTSIRKLVASRIRRHVALPALTLATLVASVPGAAAAPVGDELEVALSLADFLRAARTVVAEHQDTINDPDRKGSAIEGEEVVVESLVLLESAGSDVPDALGGPDRLGRFLALQAEAIREVVDENRATIDQPGVAFKGFVPAVFARLVNERFGEKAGGEARLKLTAPLELVRNRRARPDSWERSVIEERFLAADWPHGQRHVGTSAPGGREAFRMMVPEYYGSGCLSCHGGPAGDLDITGYPKEGAEHGALGGAISVTIFR